MGLEFRGWPKTPRLFRDMVITEKIDGTNAAVIFLSEDDAGHAIYPGHYYAQQKGFGFRASDGTPYIVGAQSRNRLITPTDDNAGFAQWVLDNMVGLADVLGRGYHYGEWWGSGIQRGYGLEKGEKRFSLFNVNRYGDQGVLDAVPGLSHVPILGRYTFSTSYIQGCLDRLDREGSLAAPGFMRPEGLIVFHAAARSTFKVTLENDAVPKGATA